LHHALPKLFGLISKYLSLPADELALKLSQFLRFPHTNQLLSTTGRSARLSAAACLHSQAETVWLPFGGGARFNLPIRILCDATKRGNSSISSRPTRRLPKTKNG